MGRGFPVAARRYRGPRGSRPDETAASPCPVEVFQREARSGSEPSGPPAGTEAARGAGQRDGEAAKRKVQWRGIYL